MPTTLLFTILLLIASLTGYGQATGTSTDKPSITEPLVSTSTGVSSIKPLSSSIAKQDSTQSNTSEQRNEITDKPKDLSVGIMLCIVVCCGLLGGLWNYLRSKAGVTAVAATVLGNSIMPDDTDIPSLSSEASEVNPGNWHRNTCLVGGIVAAGIVPFLLQSASSTLLTPPTTFNYFVFAAYCLAAAVSSSAFIDAASSSVIRRLQSSVLQTQSGINKLRVEAREALAGGKTNAEQIKELQNYTEALLMVQRSVLPTGNAEADKEALNNANTLLESLVLTKR